ncbi:hypothetical protein [Palleronia caenipelagi]|uniref:DUF2384 domain-containing protein n=1 Tax=Palleronia caenipelagi TaxID=2489174 RepID=A0A547PND9_9RHOB|nr:hypothetical protein [Palleronia caenipelagi]TRD15663.1 hypothetical protein FEV53_15360 [Palleronia caenipelagi]
MSGRTDLSALLNFIAQEQLWHDRLQEVVGEHAHPMMEEFDLGSEELEGLLGESATMLLWGCGFEDFLARRYPDGNIIDLYLKRRGWADTVANRAYFAALRDTPVSLYEVSDVRPGHSMVLRDLLTSADPVTVQEKSATQSLHQWDRIAARVVPWEEHFVMSGAALPYSADATAMLLDALRDEDGSPVQITREILFGLAPLFTGIWLGTELERMLDQEELEILNRDGDPLMFHELRFPFAKGVTQKQIAPVLNERRDMMSEGSKSWVWIETGKTRHSTASEGYPVFGSVDLKGRALIVNVDSAARAAKAEAVITDLLGEVLRPPLTTIETVGQVSAAGEATADADDAIPPELVQQILQEQMDLHYRSTLDSPLPMLDGLSPREAARDPSMRDKVVGWLKHLENGSARSNAATAGYDFTWMWRELGVMDDRR